MQPYWQFRLLVEDWLLILFLLLLILIKGKVNDEGNNHSLMLLFRGPPYLDKKMWIYTSTPPYAFMA
jgi:hypothetical protein